MLVWYKQIHNDDFRNKGPDSLKSSYSSPLQVALGE